MVSPTKPKSIAGGVYVAPLGTTLPTDATTALGAAFKPLGPISEDGVTRSISVNSSTIHAWGGYTVATMHGAHEETVSFRCLDADNAAALGVGFAVTGAMSTGLTVVPATGEAMVNHSVVIEMLRADGSAQRLVIPEAALTEVGDIVYKDDEIASLEYTLACIADDDGVPVYDYRKAATTTSGG